MTVDAQLRSLAEAISAEQRPVTVEEVWERATNPEVFDDRAGGRSWMLVAASMAMLLGGVVALLAWNRTPDDDRPPVVSISETLAPETTTPSTTVPVTTSPVPSSIAPPDALGEPLVNEPTLDYRNGVEWWAPRQLPTGWRYGYASQDGDVQLIRLLDDDGSTIDIAFGVDPSSIDRLSSDSPTEEVGGEQWRIFDEGLARDVDGQLLAVLGPDAPARVVAGGLELVSETELVRPPFRDDAEPGPVVLTLSAEELGGEEPFELRAHTDGLFTTVGGEIKRVSSDDPVAFGNDVYELSGDAESQRVVMTGVALAGLEQIQFGLLDGEAASVTPTPSDRFAEDFYALVITVPTSVLEQYDQGSLASLTRWTLTHVDGEQRVYDEPGVANCVNCDDVSEGADPGAGPEVDSGLSPLAFEPTNVYGDEMWWLPAAVPDGYEFDYAVQRWGVEGDHTVAYRSTGTPENQVTVTQSSAADAVDLPVPTDEEQLGGIAWSWSGDGNSGELSRIIGDRRVSVQGERQVALAFAATLELVPESSLERPPFRYGVDLSTSTSIVVARLPGGVESQVSGRNELRASTDGVAIALDGGFPERPAPDQPLKLQGGGMTCGDDLCVARVVGITLPDVATVDIEQLDGEVVSVVPSDLSGHFGIGFFVVELEVPAFAADFPSVVPSVVARDEDGKMLAAINEPM